MQACRKRAFTFTGADPGFFERGVVSMRVQGKRPRAEEVREGKGKGNV